MGSSLQSYLWDVGIHHKPGPPHSPRLNGVAERSNQTLFNRLSCCLINADLPKIFWADALRHLVFAMNSIPCCTPAGFDSPNSINGLPLVDSTSLHPFGFLVWYKVPEANRKKLDPKGRASLLLSYLGNGNGYRLFYLETRKVIKSRDVIFRDDVFPYSHPISKRPLQPKKIDINWPISSPSHPSSSPSPCITIFRSDCCLKASTHNPDNVITPWSLANC